MKLLLEKGAEPDSKDNYGQTARNGCKMAAENVVKLLLEEDAQ